MDSATAEGEAGDDDRPVHAPDSDPIARRNPGDAAASVRRTRDACGPRFDASARLPSLKGMNTLVVSAAHDCIARPAYGKALAEAIPGARYVEFADAGHAVTIQHAAEINSLLLEHFSRPS